MPLLNDRDDAVLHFILRYKYVDKAQLKKHLFPMYGGTSEPVYYKVMNKLEQAGYIQKRSFPRGAMSRAITVLFYLTDKGAKYLARSLPDGEATVEKYYKRITTAMSSINHYYHRMRMTDFRIALDKDMAENQVLHEKFLLTDTERIQRGGKRTPITAITTADGQVTTIPDITFCLRSNSTGGEQLFFVEIDTAKETIMGRKNPLSVGSIAEKYDNYLRILEDGNFTEYLDTTVRAFRVLTVTETQRHIEGIQTKLQYMTKYPELFLLATHEDIQKYGLMGGQVWRILESDSPKISLSKILGIN